MGMVLPTQVGRDIQHHIDVITTVHHHHLSGMDKGLELLPPIPRIHHWRLDRQHAPNNASAQSAIPSSAADSSGFFRCHYFLPTQF